MPITLSLQDGEAAARKMREILLRHPEVLTVVSQHGRPDDGSDASPFSNVELFAPLKPFDEWPKGLTKDKLTEQIQREFQNELPGVIFNFSQYIEDNIEEGISGVKGVNSVKIVGPNLEELTKLAEPGPRPDEPGSRRCRSRHFPGPRPAKPEHQSGSGEGRALRPQFRRCEFGRSSGHGWGCSDLRPGGRPAVRSGGPLHAGIPPQHRRNPEHQSGIHQPPAAPTPTSR